jgi:tripartite-type tricarboxylate transporter receptor subunit TctC
VPALADRKFPSKPIRLVVPFAPGSGSDFVRRALGREGAPASGTLVVENQSWLGGGIGGVAVARAKPDGHTLLVAATTTFVLEMLLKRVSGSTAGR